MTRDDTNFRVVVLDDEKPQFEQYLEPYREIFRFAGGNVSIVHCGKKGDLPQFLRTHPHVVICDVDLGGQNGKQEGLEAVAEFKEKYPDVLFVAATRMQLDVEQFGVKYPNPDVFIAKIYLKQHATYRKQLSADLSWRVRRNCVSPVDLSSEARKAAFAGFRGAPPSDAELQSLISQITFVGHNLDATTAIQRVKLSPLTGGRSGAAVFEMRAYSAADEPLGVPGVLKISAKDDARTELANYDRYVKWFLPYAWRVDVLGSGFIDKHGAVCYSFVNGGKEGAFPLSRFLSDGCVDVVDSILSTIFSPNSQTWYSMRRLGARDLSAHYGGRPYFWDEVHLNRASERFRESLEEFARKSSIFLRSVNQGFVLSEIVTFKSPSHLLFSQDWGEYTECVCHGDLNSNNIFCNSRLDSFAFIDFQQTDYAHVFRDFVAFESSIRLDLPKDHGVENMHLGRFVEQERLALDLTWAAPPLPDTADRYLREVLKVRHAAWKNFPDQEFYQYVFSVAVHGFRLINMGRWSEVQVLRLLGSTIAALVWLETFRAGQQSFPSTRREDASA